MQPQELLQEERERNEQTSNSWRKLLQKCKILHDQLRDCSIENLMHTKGEYSEHISNIPSTLDPWDILGTSSDQIGRLTAEVLLELLLFSDLYFGTQ